MSRFPRPSLTPLLLGTALLVIVYLTFTSARYVIHNYQLHQQEQQVRNDLAQLQKDHQQLIAVRDYLKSDEYVEDVARRTLGLVKPGETLVIVSGTTPVAPTPTAGLLPDRTPQPAWWKALFEPSGAPVPMPTAGP